MDVESVRLFVERARATQPDFSLTREEAADVVEICRRLDGIPLALELAAARVRMLGVGQIRARLGDRFKLLARPGAGSSRQQTLLATIQWSWDHLLPPEQDLMMRLAVFAGGWTLERAAAVVSDSGDEFEVLDVLTRLAERSFVVVDRQASAFARYRFLESVHQFALEKLRADPAHDVIRERHLETYLQLAVSAKIALTGPRQAQMLEELKHEEENVIAALSWCGRAADGARRRLVLAESMTRFWMLLGRYDLGRRILEEAIERDAGNPPSAARALALTRAAGAATTVGDHESARLRLEESLAFWKSSEDKSGLPAVVAGLGVIAMYQERFEDALRLFEESLALYEQRGQTRGIAMTLHNLGTIETALERPGHGRAHFERALGMFREIGDHSTETLCLGALTVSRLRGGDVEAARRSMLECFDRLAALESPREGAYAIDAFVELLLVTGRSSDAARFIGAAEATRATYHLEVLPLERAEMDRLASRVRATLGSDEMERVIASGRKLTLASAVVEGTRILRSRPVVS
jgi:non-specific serine/threonine protein kinase